MRVLHVVSGMAPDNRFGGVTRVALDLARGQRSRGHRVLVAGAALGYRRPPVHVDGVRVLLARGTNPTPRLGLGSVVAPGLLLKLVRPMLTADVVHVHLGRDFTSLGAALLARLLRRPLVVQTHGMLDAPSNSLARLIDRTLTRSALAGASVALVLIDEERVEVERLGPTRLSVRTFPNGIDVPPKAALLSDRKDDVVFLARLHPRKGAVEFAKAATMLVEKGSQFRFRILGPDEGDAGNVRSVLADHARPAGVQLEGPADHTRALAVLAAARVFVLPAIREPFGMTLLEAMAAGTPVVVHESAALAPVIVAAGAGVDFGPASGRTLASAISTLLVDERWPAASGAARLLVETRFALRAVIAELDAAYVAAGKR